MSSENDKILQTFRKELFEEGVLHEGDSIGTNDETLLRFLRARKFDLLQAKKMITDCQEWRKTVEGVGIDELYRTIDPFDYPERKAVFDCWPMWFHKTDKRGRPINVHFFGGFDLAKLHAECTPERHWQSVIVNAESLTREVLPGASRQAGHPIGNTLVIVDLKGFGLSKFWQVKSLARSSFQISQDYFPETMGQLAVINAPSSFTFIWSIMRPWLSKETADKLSVFGSNYKEELLKLADAESLPSVLGGSCTCEEYGGCEMSGAGPWMDGRVGWGPKAKAATAAAATAQKSGDATTKEKVSVKSSHENLEPKQDITVN
ncbi:CRAL-TRIO domain-containing protein [Infundibulicybe gibba]|nr:CRAL-TRIO domain-containing protein [Infundibulicybe gibba]